jgi:hypothetical protein
LGAIAPPLAVGMQDFETFDGQHAEYLVVGRLTSTMRMILIAVFFQKN